MKDDSARDKAIDRLVQKRLRAGRARSVSSCPDAELLAAYVERTLAPSEVRSCEAHLASCLGCQALIAELVRLSEADDALDSRAAGAVESRAAGAASSPAANAFRFRWAWAGSALAAMLVVGLWYTGQFQTVLERSPGRLPVIQNQAANPPATVPPVPVVEKRSASPSVEQLPAGQAPEPKSQGHAETSSPRKKSPRNEAARSQNAGSADKIAVPAPITSTFKAERSTIPVPADTPALDKRPESAPVGGMLTPTERGTLAKATHEGGGETAQIPGGRLAGRAGSTVDLGMSAGDNSKPEPSAASPKLAAAPVMRALETQHSAADVATSARTASRAAEKSDVTAATRPLLRADAKAKQRAYSASAGAGAESVQVQTPPAPMQWRVGPRGLIQRRDSHGNWKTRSSGVKADLNDISFSNPTVGWAVGQSGTVIRTTDGGNTWSSVPCPTEQDLVRVNAASVQAASVVTRAGATITTLDGGKTWQGR